MPPRTGREFGKAKMEAAAAVEFLCKIRGFVLAILARIDAEGVESKTSFRTRDREVGRTETAPGIRVFESGGMGGDDIFMTVITYWKPDVNICTSKMY